MILTDAQATAIVHATAGNRAGGIPGSPGDISGLTNTTHGCRG